MDESKEFYDTAYWLPLIEQMKLVLDLQNALLKEKQILQGMCKHKNLDGTLAIPKVESGNEYPDCSICGKSSYLIAQE